MDNNEAYKWGEIFISDWKILTEAMNKRATVLGLDQKEKNRALIWHKNNSEKIRWIFIDDPAEIEIVREVFTNADNTASPCCYIVVKQNDPSDSRGDDIYDIFRMSPESYLWHFNRVYTRPK